MDKNYYNYADADTKNQKRTRRMLLLAGLAIVVGIAVVIALSFRSTHKFRVVDTNPATNKITTLTPYFKINFSEKVSGKDVKLSSSPSIIKSYQTSGNTLAIQLTSADDTLDNTQEYTITVESVSSDGGARIFNQTFKFTPQDVAPSQLPSDQQQVLQKQDQAAGNPATAADIDFEGLDILFNQPISYAPIFGLQQAFFQFMPYTQAVAVDPNSVSSVQQGNPTIENFSVTIDNTSYKANLTYTTEVLRLRLSDTNGKQIFDSKDIDLGQIPRE